MSRISQGRWCVVLAVVVVAVAIAAGALFLGGSSTIRSGPLEVATKNLNFGEVWAQDRFEWNVPIRNVSGEDVEIVDLRFSCDCTTIERKTLLIPAGSAAEMRLALDLASGHGIHATSQQRPLSVDILPILKGGVLLGKALKVHGRIKSAFFVTPASLEIKDPTAGDGQPAAQMVTVQCHQALKDLTASCDESLAGVEVRAAATGSGRYEVILTLNPAIPAGEHDFAVTLTAVLASGERLPPVSFPVSVRKPPAVIK